MTKPVQAAIQGYLDTYPQPQHIVVAYSGGLDSHVLLHALKQSTCSTSSISAIHIHHGLQIEADDWVIHCQQVCDQLEIPLHTINVTVSRDQGQGLEAAARQARYAAFEQHLPNKAHLLLAQHANDQAETLLLQLLRGAGTAGLAAMPTQRHLGKGLLIRPLLTCSQASLQDYAQQQGLHWVDDPSNQQQQYDRNYLRQQILPRLQQRWTSCVSTLSRAAQHQADSLNLLNQYAQQQLQACQGSQANTLSRQALATLSPEQQHNVLRYWLQRQGLSLPNQTRFKEIQRQNQQADHTQQILIRWQQVECRSYRDNLYVHESLPSTPKENDLTWTIGEPAPALPLGRLHVLAENQRTIAVTIRFRQGGEQFTQHGQHKSLKNLFQTAGLPPWLRPFIPLIYIEDMLVVIPSIAQATGFEELQLAWQLN